MPGMCTAKTKTMGETQKTRRSNKPLMERRRRERINQCLNELKALVLQAQKKDLSRYSKLEKADILEMTVRHVQSLHRQNSDSSNDSSRKYRAGYSQCVSEVSHFLHNVKGLPEDLLQKVINHLASSLSTFEKSATISSSSSVQPREKSQPTEQNISSQKPTPSTKATDPSMVTGPTLGEVALLISNWFPVTVSNEGFPQETSSNKAISMESRETIHRTEETPVNSLTTPFSCQRQSTYPLPNITATSACQRQIPIPPESVHCERQSPHASTSSSSCSSPGDDQRLSHSPTSNCSSPQISYSPFQYSHNSSVTNYHGRISPQEATPAYHAGQQLVPLDLATSSRKNQGSDDTTPTMAKDYRKNTLCFHSNFPVLPAVPRQSDSHRSNGADRKLTKTFQPPISCAAPQEENAYNQHSHASHWRPW